MDVYWSELFPERIYVHVGENDLRVIKPNGKMYQTKWFDPNYHDHESLNRHKFEFLGEIQPEAHSKGEP